MWLHQNVIDVCGCDGAFSCSTDFDKAAITQISAEPEIQIFFSVISDIPFQSLILNNRS